MGDSGDWEHPASPSRLQPVNESARAPRYPRRHLAESPCRRAPGVPMGNRLSKIYTRTGDDGTTGLGDGTRVPKDGPRVEAYGTVDELNSTIGVLLAVPGLPPAVTACLVAVQHELFDMG